MADYEEQGKRLRAVRVGLCGFNNRDEFASAVGAAIGRTGALSGFGGGNVRETEGGRRELREHERAAVCKLAGVPEAFFDLPREALGGEGSTREATTLDERLERIEAKLDALVEPTTELGRLLAGAVDALEDEPQDERAETGQGDSGSHRRRLAG